MTKSDAIVAAAQMVQALIETSKEAGPMGAPLGPMYAAFMERGCSLNLFNILVDIAERTGKVTRSHNCLVYTG